MTVPEQAREREDALLELCWRLQRRGWQQVAGDVAEGKPLQEILSLLVAIGERDSYAHALINEADASERYRAACEREQQAQRVLIAARDEVRVTRARLNIARRVAAERLTPPTAVASRREEGV